MMELGTIRMVGLLRILRAYWSRTTPRPCAAWPASTSWTGEGPSDGATMAPEICRESSGSGVAFDLKIRSAMRPPVPRSPGATYHPYPQMPRAQVVHGTGPRPSSYTRACTGPLGLRRWVHGRRHRHTGGNRGGWHR